MVAKQHDVCRVIGTKKRIYRGTERKDKIRLNGKILKGFVCERKQNGETTTTTCFFNVKKQKMERVEGSQWRWLARRNSRTVKLLIEPKRVYVRGDLDREEVLAKVAEGEVTAEQAQALLV
jgi:hypothetical protein